MTCPFVGTYPISRGFLGRQIAQDAGIGPHVGVDWAMPVGTPLFAAQTGRVTYAGYSDDGAGWCVTIRVGNTLAKCFHMSVLNVLPTQEVREGQLIGYSGSSGNSTGPHLHFQMEKLKNGRWIPVDPLPEIGASMAGVGDKPLQQRHDEAVATAEDRLRTIGILQTQLNEMTKKFNDAFAAAEDRLVSIGRYENALRATQKELDDMRAQTDLAGAIQGLTMAINDKK